MTQPLVTVCLLNYKRPDNVALVLRSIESQTVAKQVFIWSNGVCLPPCATESPSVKLAVASNENLGCFPRWWLASVANTEYVCSMDDDLVFRDERVLADAIAASREKCPDGVVGFCGWRHVEERAYRKSRNVYNSSKDQPADIIKGRFMLFRQALLKHVPLGMPTWDASELFAFRCDDIYLSLCIARGQWGKHLVPGILRRRWRDLYQRGGLETDPEHYIYRDKAIKIVRQLFGEE